MAIDREATLTNAERLLRAGRLDAAIAEYARLVDEQPRDWTSVNTLGDLYVRAGQAELAAPLYRRIAEHLFADGYSSKAGALYRKILKITPGDESCELRLAEASVRQGLLADARALYEGCERRRRESGDIAGADALLLTIGDLDPSDLGARLAAAEAADRLGRSADAATRYRALCDAHGYRQDAGDPDLLRSRIDLLLRLIEVCVDGGLEAQMSEAQQMLAEAYLAAGHTEEARALAEDLRRREPEPAPELIIDPAAAPPQASDAEIDLTGALRGLNEGSPAAPLSQAATRSLDDVFEELRAGADTGSVEGTEHLELARTYLEMGMSDEAMGALELAARSPLHRFQASSLLAQLHRDTNDLVRAIEWYERAAEAPAPAPDAGRALLYDLGDALETLGETARALAVFLELQTDISDYRDVGERVARLSRAETEG